MRALVATDVGSLRLDEVPSPANAPGHVIVRVAYTGVSSGTERRKLFSPPTGDDEAHDPWPVVGAFGYMASGVIESVGDGVTGLTVGDRVHAGRPFGGHRELIDVDEHAVVAIPDELDDLTAACMYWAVPPLLGLLAATPTFNEDAAVVGLGPLGQTAVQLLERVSRRVIGIDPVASRRSLAQSLGADVVIDPSAGDVAGAVTDAMPDRPEVVLEVSGTQAGLEAALAIIRPKGRIALVGTQRPVDGLDLFWPLQHSGASIVPIHRPGTNSPQAGGPDHPARRYLPDVIDMLLRGRLAIGPLITEVVTPDAAPAAFRRLHERPDELIGMAIDWKHRA